MGKVPFVQRDPACSFLADSLAWSVNGLQRYDVLPPGRYITILPVRDYGNMHQVGDLSLLPKLSTEDKAALAQKRTLLLLDHGNEGPQFNPIIFDIFHDELKVHGIDPTQIVFAGQNRRMGLDYAAHYGAGIRFWCYDYFPKAISIWMDHELGPRIFGPEAFPVADYTPLANIEDEPRFLSFNAAARWHRMLLYRWLQLEGLSGEGLISFHGVNPGNPKSNEIDIRTPPPEIEAGFPELLAGIEDWMPPAPVRLGDGEKSGNDLIMTVDVGAYARSLFSIVSESDFFEPNIERLTEKSLKVAAMGHPFVVLGAPRTIGRIAELGFATFDGLIDHSYDMIEDPVIRMRAAFEAIRKTWSRIKENPAAWAEDAKPEAQFNLAHARYGLVKRLDQMTATPMLQRMQRFVETGEIV